ncbi:MAG: hypothetical protein WC406_12625 [Methanoregula sp.]
MSLIYRIKIETDLTGEIKVTRQAFSKAMKNSDQGMVKIRRANLARFDQRRVTAGETP